MIPPALPWFARVLLDRLVPSDWRESVEGDLREEWARRVAAGRRGMLWMLPVLVLTGLRLSRERRAEYRDAPGAPSRRPHAGDGLASDVRYALD